MTFEYQLAACCFLGAIALLIAVTIYADRPQPIKG